MPPGAHAMYAWIVFWWTYLVVGFGLCLLQRRRMLLDPNSSEHGRMHAGPVTTTSLAANLCWNALWSLVVVVLLDGNQVDQRMDWGLCLPHRPMWWLCSTAGCLACQWVGSLLFAECITYYVHRLLHTSWCFARIHRQHHLFVKPNALAALYGSPIETLLCHMPSLVVGPYLTGMSTLQLCIWAWAACVNSLCAHSGITDASWGGAQHDLHHSRHRVNYSFLTLLDKVHGTYAHK